MVALGDVSLAVEMVALTKFVGPSEVVASGEGSVAVEVVVSEVSLPPPAPAGR